MKGLHRLLSLPRLLLASTLCLSALSTDVFFEDAIEDGAYMKREHCLTKPYHGTGMDVPFWEFGGSTVVTSSYVRLTPDRQSKRGILWNTVPVSMHNWEVVIEFQVHGQGKHLFGDGFAFWYTKEKGQVGPVFGSKDYFTGLGIFFDTYSNHNGEHKHDHPYISSMVNDGTLHYDHDRDGTHGQMDGCTVKFRNSNHDTFATITYVDRTLSVMTNINGNQDWNTCFTVGEVDLPTGYYFGFSATTGDLADNHDIITVRVYDIDELQSIYRLKLLYMQLTRLCAITFAFIFQTANALCIEREQFESFPDMFYDSTDGWFLYVSGDVTSLPDSRCRRICNMRAYQCTFYVELFANNSPGKLCHFYNSRLNTSDLISSVNSKINVFSGTRCYNCSFGVEAMEFPGTNFRNGHINGGGAFTGFYALPLDQPNLCRDMCRLSEEFRCISYQRTLRDDGYDCGLYDVPFEKSDLSTREDHLVGTVCT